LNTVAEAVSFKITGKREDIQSHFNQQRYRRSGAAILDPRLYSSSVIVAFQGKGRSPEEN
jgi:hypothetical protein